MGRLIQNAVWLIGAFMTLRGVALLFSAAQTGMSIFEGAAILIIGSAILLSRKTISRLLSK